VRSPSRVQGYFPLRMRQLLLGFVTSAALYTVAERDIATALLSGPSTVAQLAGAADAEVLRRVIRLLASLGVFRMDDDTVEITELGAILAEGTKHDHLRAGQSGKQRALSSHHSLQHQRSVANRMAATPRPALRSTIIAGPLRSRRKPRLKSACFGRPANRPIISSRSRQALKLPALLPRRAHADQYFQRYDTWSIGFREFAVLWCPVSTRS
jgi:hypothetical protein